MLGLNLYGLQKTVSPIDDWTEIIRNCEIIESLVQ